MFRLTGKESVPRYSDMSEQQERDYHHQKKREARERIRDCLDAQRDLLSQYDGRQRRGQ